jgi:hypothetical protein
LLAMVFMFCRLVDPCSFNNNMLASERRII